ncbi:uncharacterized protein [Centruroides vittatus]|uniref:uncharacterized protein n=1 Tax=Centruroides vittatus TaxID=120091 RepID=UPI003510B4B5
MGDVDLSSKEFWAKCTTGKFYKMMETDYSELGLNPAIDNAFEFAVKLGIQQIESTCSTCDKTRKIHYGSERNECRLTCSSCAVKYSVYEGTFKSKCGRLSWGCILSFIWHYLCLECGATISALASGISRKASVDWSNHIRLVMMISLSNTMTSFKIGGPNKIVEIDETVICKRKYEKGRLSKSTKWVVGGICRQDGNCFICQVNDRSEQTLNWIVYKYVNSGSLIITDEWKGYNHIDDIEGVDRRSIPNEDQGSKLGKKCKKGK